MGATVGSDLTRGRKKIRTVVADDSAAALRAVCSFLQSRGTFEVVGTARNGLQCVTLAHHTRPDLVIMDVHMPEMNGIEATASLVGQLPATKVILITVDDIPQLREECARAGAAAFLGKKRIGADLLAAIDSVLSH